PFVDHVRAWIDEGLCVLLVAAYRSQAQRWSDLLESYPVDVQLVEDPLTPSALSIIRRDARPRAYMVIGRLNGGFVDHQSQLALIGYEELFGRKVHKPRRRSESPFSTDFQDLRPDDLVVHVDHGIGKYRGLMTLSVGGIDFDFMRIDYRGEDKLYVPVAQLNKVQKLTGTEKVPPLAKLGAATWAKTKGKVKAAVREMADDLLRLYAQRAASPGHAFTPPDSFFREFEAAFPFEETPDQERVIAEVLDDMARDQTMDRLVCGDVGFGKTEVAMRAAFKAVLDGKQVAVLCPTTVLAEQHLLSFRDRFHRYPVRIESLSRFKSKPEQKEVLKALAAGQIDVVISTHRLLSKDVVFRDLGLLVVDEEHRFGVAHKERLKQLKHQIDVLTLTATPIPRTLNMSLSGIRDLSIIATPPQDRLAVVTRVEPTNDRTIREAILFELRRGGQVYFVHNRVQDIEKVSDKLAELVPEARLVIAHGQLGEGELEKRMLSFMHGEANVLICTTIIESGIDIPRANTMFIHRADAFGLAQLYQLRGRVGRSKDRAFCYLLVPKPDALTNDARQRIGVMQRFSELGAGFQIATYDLEIRGAGELLGTSQSGQIAAVGFELYSQLLAEAVAELRGEAIDDIPDPEIKVAVEALIPESYVPDTNVRLILYKKLAASRNEEELQYAV
ncbi:MAG: transcription-repair coupling factor, partial [Myxococcales bacterium]|nr:transcription-repair coupling factor [Myxococcales bacterium]